MSALPGVLEELAPLLDRYGYFAIAGTLVLENAGLPLPGEMILVAGAVYAGSGRLDLGVVAVTAFIAAIVGDNIGYLVGRFAGRALVLRYGAYVLLTPERFEAVHRLFERHGGAIVVVARFVEGLRQFNGVVAGTSGMRWGRFFAFNAVGAGLWVLVWVVIGSFAGEHVAEVYRQIRRYQPLLLLVTVVVVLAALLVWRWKQRRASAAGDRPER